MATTKRNTQLDGWRAFAVLGVMAVHWLPRNWRGPFPFEIGLFFFLTLTGFLITRILLRERAAGEMSGGKWRGSAYLDFQKRRMTRILIPCYVAMLFALAVGAQDIWENPFSYFGHWVNFRMAFMDGWPSGTAHYWSLAVQMQFYVLWPLVVFWVPQRFLKGAFLRVVAIAPLSRFIIYSLLLGVTHSEAITITAMDYFGVGALLALALEGGMKAGDRRLKWAGILAFCGYAALYISGEMGREIPGLRYFQQTLLAVAFAGLISATLAGFSGFLGKLLDSPPIQHIGKLSYGLYLFHTPVPLFLGYVMPFLWEPFFVDHWQIIRLAAFGLTSWGLAYLSWRYLESMNLFPNKRSS